jgi:transcriptional regulator with XRE-family HTH domain
MTSRATTLGGFIAELMEKQQHSNRSLAAAAGISEGAVRNLLKYGREPKAKDPDARTLQSVANALGVNPLRLYRLAGYLPPAPDVHSVRAEFVADVFDRLAPDKQEAVLGVIDAMADNSTVNRVVQEIRNNPSNPLAGFDLHQPRITRLIANELIVKYQMTEVVDIDKIEPDAQVFTNKWSDLPPGNQERIKALIRHKLTLQYDPTMVDPEWRD